MLDCDFIPLAAVAVPSEVSSRFARMIFQSQNNARSLKIGGLKILIANGNEASTSGVHPSVRLEPSSWNRSTWRNGDFDCRTLMEMFWMFPISICRFDVAATRIEKSLHDVGKHNMDRVITFNVNPTTEQSLGCPFEFKRIRLETTDQALEGSTRIVETPIYNSSASSRH